MMTTDPWAPEELQFEELTHENYPLVRKLDREDIPVEYVHPVDKIMEITDSCVKHGLPGHTFAVKLRGEYVGLILLGETLPWKTDPPQMAEQPCYRLMGFVVGKAYRGMGLGGEILEQAVERVYRDFGVRPIVLCCHMDNHNAARFYKKHGFRWTPYRETDDYYYFRYPELWEREKHDSLCLVEPSLEMEPQLLAFRQDFLDAGQKADGTGRLLRYESIRDWLAAVEAGKHPETVPEGKVPAIQFVGQRASDGKIVGMLQIRPRLNEYLEQYAGHIGYCVCPSERRRGYATEMLRQALPICKELGLDRVLVCCRPDNEGSRRTIRSNGGVWESTVHVPDRDTELERWWIDLTAN